MQSRGNIDFAVKGHLWNGTLPSKCSCYTWAQNALTYLYRYKTATAQHSWARMWEAPRRVQWQEQEEQTDRSWAPPAEIVIHSVSVYIMLKTYIAMTARITYPYSRSNFARDKMHSRSLFTSTLAYIHCTRCIIAFFLVLHSQHMRMFTHRI